MSLTQAFQELRNHDLLLTCMDLYRYLEKLRKRAPPYLKAPTRTLKSLK